MSLAKSTVFTIGSRCLTSALGLAVIPIYLARMGAEAYGLVAFFATLQAWFQLLDIGLTAAMSRESARFRAGAVSVVNFRALNKTLKQLFYSIACAGGLLAFFASGPISLHWFRLETISIEVAERSIQCMAILAALWLITEFHRSVLVGFEKMALLGIANTTFGFFRLAGVIPFLDTVDSGPVAFLVFQIGICLLEFIALRSISRKLLDTSAVAFGAIDFSAIRSIAGFSFAMFLATVIWMMISQFDRIILSGLLTLSDYGDFSVIASVAMMPLVITGSVAQVIAQRLNRLYAGGLESDFLKLYERFSQWTAVLSFSITSIMLFHASHLLTAWSNNPSFAEEMAPILVLYVLGNAIMSLSALPYYLQLAHGKLSLHLAGSCLMAVLLIPLTVIATYQHGMAGAGQAWLAVNLLYFLTWPGIAHKRFAPGLHIKWLISDIIPASAVAAIVGWLSYLLPWPADRLNSIIFLSSSASIVLLCSAFAAPLVRDDILQKLSSCLNAHFPKVKAYD